MIRGGKFRVGVQEKGKEFHTKITTFFQHRVHVGTHFEESGEVVMWL